MRGNLCQPIAVPAIGVMDDLVLGAAPLKQHDERGPTRLRLSPRDLAEGTIRLMLGNERLGTEIDLARQLLPGPRPSPPVRHKLAVAHQRLAGPGAKLFEHPVGRQPWGDVCFARGRPITAPGPCRGWGTILARTGLSTT